MKSQIITGLVAAAIIIAAIGAFIGFGTPRGQSQYTGHVVDVEHDKGIVLPTTQVHMKTNPRSSSKETFCVMDEQNPEHLERLRGAARNNSRVTVTYSRPLFVWRGKCDTGLSVVKNVAS